MKMKSKLLNLALAMASLAVFPHSARADAAEDGKKLYHAACAMCHGADLNAAGGIPDLRKSKLDEDNFLQTVRNGRPGTIMPPMKGNLSDEDIRKVRAYIKASSGG